MAGSRRYNAGTVNGHIAPGGRRKKGIGLLPWEAAIPADFAWLRAKGNRRSILMASRGLRRNGVDARSIQGMTACFETHPRGRFSASGYNKLNPSAHRIGGRVVGLMRFGLVRAVPVALAALAAIAAMAVAVASAGMMLAVAGMALAILAALPLAAALAHVAATPPPPWRMSPPPGANVAAAFVVISVVVGAFRVPARVAVGAAVGACRLDVGRAGRRTGSAPP